jgi:hypothetical protein
MRNSTLPALLAALGLPASASAIVVDGTREVDYGSPLAVQAVETQFGNAAPPGNLGGSELDAAWATVENGRLYLMITGNQEPNFNRLEIFIDSKPGGENTLTGTPQYDFFNGSAWSSQNLVGLTFDSGPVAGGFTADYHLFSGWGSGTGPYQVSFVNRSGGGSAMVPGSTGSSAAAVGLVAAGSIAAGNVGGNASATALTQSLEFAINDNNAAGVGGGTNAADGLAAVAVTTGMEFSIALADLGNPADGTSILIAAMINGSNHDYLSNQILGALPAPQGNLGGNGAGGFIGNLSGVDFDDFEGAQYFAVVVPEPSTASLLGLALIALAAAQSRSRGDSSGRRRAMRTLASQKARARSTS